MPHLVTPFWSVKIQLQYTLTHALSFNNVSLAVAVVYDVYCYYTTLIVNKYSVVLML